MLLVKLPVNNRLLIGKFWDSLKLNVDFLLGRDWVPQPFPGGSDGKQSACNVGDLGLIPGLRRSPGRGQGNPLQCFCLENPHGQRNLMAHSGPKGYITQYTVDIYIHIL